MSNSDFIEKRITDIYVKEPSHRVGFLQILNAIDKGGGQTCNVNGILRELDNAGYKIVSK